MTRADEAEAARRIGKSAAAFRTTGEVAEELDLPAYVLRFWETKFPQVKPLKRSGGRRYYRPEDVDLLRRIRQCLHQQGYTIRGVQQLLHDGGLRAGELPRRDGDAEDATPALVDLDPLAAPPDPAADAEPALRSALEELRRELLDLRALIGEMLAP